MKIVIDDKIPYIKGVFEPFAEVLYLPGDLTTAEVVKDADVLVTRTRTRCDKDLLQGSNVQFIATATIGFDHIDTRYCEAAGIQWENAPGCNAESVNQYIASALFSYCGRKGIDLKDITIGIVGIGEVGSRVAKTCEILGMNVLLNDPPRERKEGPLQFVSLETIRHHSDMISFHVPLNLGGPDNTLHMVGGEFLRNLGRNPLLINTSRGEVFDTEAVKSAIDADFFSGLIIDCWENEPELDLGLLNRVDFGTPHIAGYSRDGKSNGTKASVRAISRFFNLGMDDWQPSGVERPGNSLIDLDGKYQSEQSLLSDAVLATYQIAKDDRALRNSPHLFEPLRGDYPVRREFGFYSVTAANVETETLKKLKELGFNCLY